MDVSSTGSIIFVPKSIKMETAANIILAECVNWESSNRTYTFQNETSLQDKREMLVDVLSNSDFMPKSSKKETTANIFG